MAARRVKQKEEEQRRATIIAAAQQEERRQRSHIDFLRQFEERTGSVKSTWITNQEYCIRMNKQ